MRRLSARLADFVLVTLLACLMTGVAQAGALRFEDSLGGGKVPACSFTLDGDWSPSPYLPAWYYLDAVGGASPIRISVSFSHDSVSGMQRDSRQNAEKVLRTLERGSGRQPGATYSIVSLNSTVHGVAMLAARSMTIWVYEGAYALCISYTDGQAEKPDIAPAVLAQVCKTFAWKRQH